MTVKKEQVFTGHLKTPILQQSFPVSSRCQVMLYTTNDMYRHEAENMMKQLRLQIDNGAYDESGFRKAIGEDFGLSEFEIKRLERLS